MNYYIITNEIKEGMESAISSQSERLNFSSFGCHFQDQIIVTEGDIQNLYNAGADLNQAAQNAFGMSLNDLLHGKKVFDYRVMSLISDEFKSFPIENIDFTIHLKPQIALDKSVRTFHKNGRPNYVEYTYQGTRIARRVFEFQYDPTTNFLISRIEKLCYIRKDDSLGEYFIIKSKAYDSVNDSDLVMQEREEARRKIIGDIKGLVLKVLTLADPTKNYDYNLRLATNFFRSNSDYVSLFIETGLVERGNGENATYIIDSIREDSSHSLLNLPVFGLYPVGNTLREAIIDILTY